MKGAPAKAGAKVSGVQMQTSTLNENSKRSVTDRGTAYRAAYRLNANVTIDRWPVDLADLFSVNRPGPGERRAYEIGLRANKRSVNSADISCANSPRSAQRRGNHGSRRARNNRAIPAADAQKPPPPERGGPRF
jgi:hypothetical protein